MPQQVADRRDQDFVIWEQMNCEEILKHETYREFNKKTCDMILTEARALAMRVREEHDKVMAFLRDFDAGT